MPKKQTQVENGSAKTFSLISNEKLLAIYTAMLKCRLLEQRATALFQHGRLDTDLHVSAGLEATAAAAVVDLEPADTLCLAPNDWLPAFVKGMSLEAIFRVLAPSSSHLDGPTQIEAEHKNILLTSEKGALQSAALERARAALAAKDTAVTAAFIPSGNKPLAQWQKAIQTAGSRRLPIIFIHYSNADHRASATRAQKPEALIHGVPSIGVDARDPVAVYRVAYEAIVRARQLRGATLLECIIDPQPKPSVKAGGGESDPLASDPVTAMESYLKSKNITPETDKQDIVSAFNRDLDLATRFLDR
jgi:acetoin:2,6-dichlorophenolindophenol oxidoreductase subunit alpha